MTDPIFSPGARQDLKSILEYISRDNPTAAIAYVEKIRSHCRKLVSFPEIGTRRANIKPNLRGLPFGSHIIYYSIKAEGVRIERIMHGAQDIDTYFSSE